MHQSRWFLVLFMALLAACGAAQPAAPAATTAPAAATSAPAPITPAATFAPAPAAQLAATSAPEATAAPSAQTTELTVFAAAALTDAFKEIGKNFETANSGTTVTFNFAGSQQLAQQIGQGAPADVFASANNAQMNALIKSGEVISGTQRTFVRNRLVVIYPKDNPAHIATLSDLARPGIKLVLAAKAVPVGLYALDFLAKASKLPEYTSTYSPTVLANVVSYEQDVKAVLGKVTLGEADAGIVYVTDISLDAADKVGKLDIPDSLNTIATYPIATIKDSKHADLAKKFMDYILSPDAQTVLVKYGFIPTTGSATGAAPTAAPLAIAGKIDTPMTLTGDDLKKLDQVDVKATDKGGTEQTYTGVPIAILLKNAGVQSGAQKVVFTGGDGYTAELSLTDLQADKDAIIAIDGNGALRDIIPTQMPKVWVKGLVKIDVQ
jgi:molybdate transport system substrate-binding protein